MDIYLNGKMVGPQRARVRVDDAGFQHAVGLFETMAVRHGRVFRLQQHLRRLEESARQLGMVRHLHTDPLARAVEKTVVHNQLDDARLRLTVTTGPLSLLHEPPAELPPPTVIIAPTTTTIYEPAYFERGITVQVAHQGANPFDPLAGHKTLSYWGRLRALRAAAAVGAGEAIWLNVSNHLASGAVSNLFLVKDGTLLTPWARGEEVPDALPAPVLPGITRAAVLELAQSMSIPVKRSMLAINDLLDADEVLLTNSSWGVLPVTKVEKKSIADSRVGPTTTRLRNGLLELIEKETNP